MGEEGADDLPEGLVVLTDLWLFTADTPVYVSKLAPKADHILTVFEALHRSTPFVEAMYIVNDLAPSDTPFPSPPLAFPFTKDSPRSYSECEGTDPTSHYCAPEDVTVCYKSH